MTSDLQTKAIVLQFYQCFDERKIEDALSLLSANFIAHLVGIPETLDKEGFSQFGMSFYSAFSQGQHQFEEILVADDTVMTCGTFTAKHLGSFQGLPPTGKEIQLSIMHIDRVENGEIVEHWGQGDALGLVQQLGMIVLPGPRLLPHILKGAFAQLLGNRSE